MRRRSVVVAVDRDDTAVLITLTARELAPNATIVAAVREEENVHLLHQSGADSVITSSAAAGACSGMATETPEVDRGASRTSSRSARASTSSSARSSSGGRPERARASRRPMCLAVVRDGELIRFDDPRAAELREGDKVIELRGRG